MNERRKGRTQIRLTAGETLNAGLYRMAQRATVAAFLESLPQESARGFPEMFCVTELRERLKTWEPE